MAERRWSERRAAGLADRVLVALLRLEGLARQARAAARRLFCPPPAPRALRLGWRRLAEAAESGPDGRRAQHPAGRLALLVVEEAGDPEQQRIGEPEGGAAGQPADAARWAANSSPTATSDGRQADRLRQPQPTRRGP